MTEWPIVVSSDRFPRHLLVVVDSLILCYPSCCLLLCRQMRCVLPGVILYSCVLATVAQFGYV